MQFNVENDLGNRIILWVALTNPMVVPRIVVSAEGGPTYELSANVVRPELRTHGMHATGECGFELTEELIPGVLEALRLTIREASSGLLLYKRDFSGTSWVEGRLFFLETQARRHDFIDRSFFDRFHMAYTALETLPADTAKFILRMPYTLSLYASGRLPLDPIEDTLRRLSFKVAVRIQDPAREVFDRILMLTEPEAHQAILTTLMPAPVLARLASRLRGVSIRQLDEIGGVISRLDNEAVAYLSDPLTRQLVASQPGHPLPRDAAQAAVMRLAEFDIVTPDYDLAGFFQTASAVMGALPPFVPPPAEITNAPAPEVLRRQDWFARLIRFDSSVYDAVLGAAASLEPLPA